MNDTKTKIKNGLLSLSDDQMSEVYSFFTNNSEVASEMVVEAVMEGEDAGTVMEDFILDELRNTDDEQDRDLLYFINNLIRQERKNN